MKRQLEESFEILLLLTISLLSCKQPKSNRNNKTNHFVKALIDTSKFVIIQFDTTQTWIFREGKPTNLTNSEIGDIEIILQRLVAEYNHTRLKQFDKISKAHPEHKLKVDEYLIDLLKYKRQYIPVINNKGQKEIWVNCFCSTWDKNWKKEIIYVKDGGNCYFNVVINLTKKTYNKFIVNGDA